MQRVTATVQTILSALRDESTTTSTIHQVKKVAGGIDSDTLRYHISILRDAGFIDGEEDKLRLTWQGHEYLENLDRPTSAKRR